MRAENPAFILCLCAIACAGPGGGSEIETAPGEVLQGTTYEHWTPKIDLGQVLFAYAGGEEFFCEMMNPQVELYEKLKEEFDWDSIVWEPYTNSLPQSVQDLVFQSSTEYSGMPVTLYFPARRQFALAKAAGVAPQFKGLDTYSGFMLRLKAPKALLAAPHAGAIQALAIAGDVRGKARIKPMTEHPLSSEEQTELLRFLAPLTGFEGAALESVTTNYFSYPREYGYLAVISNADKKESVLYCLKQEGQAWHIVKFPKSVDTNDNGAMLYRHEIDAGWAYRNTSYYVLPDLDGDDASELLVVSDVHAFFFALRRVSTAHASTLELIKTISFH